MRPIQAFISSSDPGATCGLTHMFLVRYLPRHISHRFPYLIHAHYLCVSENMLIQGTRVRDDLRNIQTYVRHIGQGKLLVTVTNDSVVDVDHTSMIRFARWDSRDEDLEPATHVNERIRKAFSVYGTKDVEFLQRILDMQCLQDATPDRKHKPCP